MDFAVFDERIKEGGVFASFGTAHEEVVLKAEFQGADRVLDPVVVDFKFCIQDADFHFILIGSERR